MRRDDRPIPEEKLKHHHEDQHKHRPQARVLFILKRRHYSWCRIYGDSFSSGLYNSAKFCQELLADNGIPSKLVQVTDNNCIDREVTRFQPTHVVIEAIWVVPEKFDVLTSLHPEVTWIVRNHSDFPFLALEGVGLEWMLEYVKYPKVYISNNLESTNVNFKHLISDPNRSIYLPNYYKIDKPSNDVFPVPNYALHIGCFGAIRSLKNQLSQAIAAIRYADGLQRSLHFHINGHRIEEGGKPIIKSLRSLFAHSDHQLIEHDWLPRPAFLDLLGSMNLSLCVSFSESFCLVAADSVAAQIPLVTSPEITWASKLFYAEPTSIDSMVNAMRTAVRFQRIGIWLNRQNLERTARDAKRIWLESFAMSEDSLVRL